MMMQSKVIGGSSIPTDADGNIYTPVTIGTQTWLLEDLKTTKFRNGDEVPLVTLDASWASSTSAARCVYNTEYGVLYNWWAATDIRNICPIGYHIPTFAEITTLADFLGGQALAGGHLKEAGTVHWNAPNTGADNSSGFYAKGNGYRTETGLFFDLKNYTIYLCSDSYDANNCRRGYLYTGNDDFILNFQNKKYGASIRCIKY